MLLKKFKKIKFIELLELWLNDKKANVKEQSYAKYAYLVENNLKDNLGNIVFKNLTSEIVENYFNSENVKKLSLSTQRTLLYIVKSTIALGVSKKLRKELVIENIKIKKPKSRIIYFTKKEQIILESYLRNNIDLLNIGLLICLYTGIRLGEVCGLKWGDVDLNNKSITINRTIQRIKNDDISSNFKTKKIVSSPKSDSSNRVIPLPDFIINILKDFKEDNNFFILTGSLSFKDARVYERHLKNVLQICEIRQLNFHTLRHTFATRSIESGMDIKTLSEILGHSSYLITLDVYVHSTIDQKRNCINNLVDYLKP